MALRFAVVVRVGAEFAVAAAKVLDERVAVDDDMTTRAVQSRSTRASLAAAL